jgi:hypothetical protein
MPFMPNARYREVGGEENSRKFTFLAVFLELRKKKITSLALFIPRTPKLLKHFLCMFCFCAQF